MVIRPVYMWLYLVYSIGALIVCVLYVLGFGRSVIKSAENMSGGEDLAEVAVHSRLFEFLLVDCFITLRVTTCLRNCKMSGCCRLLRKCQEIAEKKSGH